MAESGAQAQVAASGPGMWRRERKDQSDSPGTPRRPSGSILKSKRFDIKWYNTDPRKFLVVYEAAASFCSGWCLTNI